jgi:thioredoxin reductase (NADPH)
LETIGRDLNEMQRVPLAESHVAALRAAGTVAHYAAGTFLVQSGDRVDRFVYVEDGEIEVVNPFTDERHVPSTLGPNQFMGEMSLLNGGAWSVPMRAVCDTRVIEVPRSAMLGLMSEIPEMSDIIITVLAARRRRQLDVGYGTLVLIGEDADRDVRRIADFLSRSRLPYASYAVGSREAERVVSVSGVAADRPAVIFGRGQVLTEPTPEKVARLLGFNRDLTGEDAFDVLIVGAGPAGVAAGVYAGAEGLNALVVEDTAIGGQAGTSSRIENYMGFPTGISGADLVWRGEVQAMKFGTRFVLPRRVTKLDPLEDGKFCATFDNGQCVRSGAVVVATGVQYQRLPIDRLAEFEGGRRVLRGDRERGALLQECGDTRHRRRKLRWAGGDVPLPHREPRSSDRSRDVAGRDHVELPAEAARSRLCNLDRIRGRSRLVAWRREAGCRHYPQRPRRDMPQPVHLRAVRHDRREAQHDVDLGDGQPR